ncbi:6,7-dimethyl-8-ribityllumazine synthase [Flavobacteriaceae bacterium]|jgi:6,7-dimethyl-8-ribityllumazine synthase|nr:6,7-dimethyl-8-ribityllumazine synthase [Flavobacteriaceae bacterium]RZP00238.1 MAG: 6,7-dimethyl-8-ribityllumazine synthase [Flavobacteriales bacterium]|tara:strand:- start:470 stop:946 length:477 start_codon:yes stop_codon:yes gene_type:complete
MSTENSNLSNFDSSTVPSGDSLTIGLVVSKWNEKITESLFNGAYTTLTEFGVKANNIKRIDVPGSFELVFGSKKMIQAKVDVVIAIGCVIKGETEHFDYICQSVSKGIIDLNINFDTPVVFCVLTDNNIQQSVDRSGGKHGNKGVEAAITALKLANLN